MSFTDSVATWAMVRPSHKVTVEDLIIPSEKEPPIHRVPDLWEERVLDQQLIFDFNVVLKACYPIGRKI